VNNSQTVLPTRANPVRWTARVASILVCAWFAFVLVLVATNEDQPRAEVIPSLILVAINIGACFAAWRWERAGGIAIIIGAIAIGIALWVPIVNAGLTLVMPILIAAYFVPFGLVGALFVWSDWFARKRA
jgi:peptidoglycan/LPS O-acetylase OafA/YrhL